MSAKIICNLPPQRHHGIFDADTGNVIWERPSLVCTAAEHFQTTQLLAGQASTMTFTALDQRFVNTAVQTMPLVDFL